MPTTKEADKHNLTIKRGATFDYLSGGRFTWKLVPEGQRHEAGTPVDLTGYTAKAQFRATDDGPALITLTTGGGGITLGGVAGTIDLVITAEQTATLDAGLSGVWGLAMYPPAGQKYPLVGGRFLVEPFAAQG